jgi:hypothetical protein
MAAVHKIPGVIGIRSLIGSFLLLKKFDRCAYESVVTVQYAGSVCPFRILVFVKIPMQYPTPSTPIFGNRG